MTRLLAALVVAALVLHASASASSGAVVLNEVNCEGVDWIEIVNTGPEAADISGWLLTDDPVTGTRSDHRLVFAAGTSIAASGTLTLDKGASGFPFGVSCGNDTIRLADAATDGTVVDEIAIPALTASGETFGRYPTGTGPWRQTAATKGAPNEPSAAVDQPIPDPAWLFEPTTVHDIDLTLPEASRDALATAPAEYVDGTFSLTTAEGTYGPYAVGVRLKGSYSFRPLSGKAAFKVKFSHSVAGQRFHGLRTLTLNNMVQDPSMVHEAISYEAFRAMGLPASRLGYADVSLNGEGYGVYANVETLDRVSLARWFPSTQHLYEGEIGPGADVVPGRADAFEVDEGSEADRSDLHTLIDAAWSDDGSFSERVAPVADLSQMTRMWAVEKYVGHFDGYSTRTEPNNFYLHSNASGVFRMLPAGVDQTLGRRLRYGDAGGALFNRCLADTVCSAQFAEAVADARATIAALHLEDRVDQIAAALAPFQATDPRREHSLGEIAAGVSAARAFVLARPGDAWPPPKQDRDNDAAPPAPGQPPLPRQAVSAPSITETTPLALSLRARHVRIRSGALRSGRTTLARLRDDDGRHLELKARRRDRRYRAGFAAATVIDPARRAELTRLAVDVNAGTTARRAGVSMEVYDWSRRRFERVLGPRRGLTREGELTWTAAREPQRYVSPAGSIRVVVRATHDAPFRLRADRLRFRAGA